MKILFLARSLNAGGAERQMTALARGLRDKGNSILVATFYGGGMFRDELNRFDVRNMSLDKAGRWDILMILRLLKVIKAERPDIIHSYLGIPNILSILMKLFHKRCCVVWGVRASNMNLRKYDWLSRLCYWLECKLSKYADLIIVNSESGLKYHVSEGFHPNNAVVVHNGIDTEKFYPRCEDELSLRDEWGWGSDQIVIGLVGRYDPMKDHKTFINAASLLTKQRKDVRFICVGRGADLCSLQTRSLCKELDMDSLFLWCGEVNEMRDVYSAFDIVVSSSSFGEGFSNVVAEAMACGVPCVVTDVGDSALIVGDCGYVVPPRDPGALSDAILKMISMDVARRREIGECARTRIQSIYSLRRMVERSAQHLEAIC